MTLRQLPVGAAADQHEVGAHGVAIVQFGQHAGHALCVAGAAQRGRGGAVIAPGGQLAVLLLPQIAVEVATDQHRMARGDLPVQPAFDCRHLVLQHLTGVLAPPLLRGLATGCAVHAAVAAAGLQMDVQDGQCPGGVCGRVRTADRVRAAGRLCCVAPVSVAGPGRFAVLVCVAGSRGATGPGHTTDSMDGRKWQIHGQPGPDAPAFGTARDFPDHLHLRLGMKMPLPPRHRQILRILRTPFPQLGRGVDGPAVAQHRTHRGCIGHFLHQHHVRVCAMHQLCQLPVLCLQVVPRAQGAEDQPSLLVVAVERIAVGQTLRPRMTAPVLPALRAAERLPFFENGG